MARFRFPYVLTLSLSTLALGAMGCSNGQSPTEPDFDSVSAPVTATSSSSVSSVTEESRGGGNNSADDNNNRRRRGRGQGGGQGADDPAGDDRGRRGRGADDPAGDDNGGRRGGRGADDNRPNAGAEFEGRVVSVNGNTLNLAGGVRVTVNGATQWSARGDLSSLSQVAAAVAANRPVRVEGRGTRQADGTFLAQTIKVEVDD